MRVRLGPGPVFLYEWLTTTRRWQLYALRVLFVGAILIGLWIVWHEAWRSRASSDVMPLRELASFGQSIYATIVVVELTLLLAAPAATAGAVCLDKARGTLDHMLATDLSNAEIVLGKLGVRLIPVLGLIACLLPVVALASLLGGIDSLALSGSFLVAIGCAMVSCALAMTLSVWGRKTHEVLMMTYILIILWLLMPWLVIAAMYLFGMLSPRGGPPRFFEDLMLTNPYWLVFTPYSNPAKADLTQFLIFLGCCLAATAGLVGLSTARIRRVALRQAGNPAGGRRFRFGLRLLPRLTRPVWLPRIPGPSLDANPVAWREWHRTRPSWMMRIAWGLYTALGLFWLALWIAIVVRENGPGRFHPEPIAMMNGFQVGLGLLLLSVSAATSLAEERARASLDILLTTPMSTRSILAGKWWGSFRNVIPVLFWPALLTPVILVQGGHIVGYVLLLGLVASYGAVITSLGLALATWISRLGRAVAACIATCVVFSIGLIILAVLLTRGPDPGLFLIMGSPICGPYFATIIVAREPMGYMNDVDKLWVGVCLWTLIHLVLAAILFAATLRTFDRRLGRMPESGGHPDSVPRAEPKPALALDP